MDVIVKCKNNEVKKYTKVEDVPKNLSNVKSVSFTVPLDGEKKVKSNRPTKSHGKLLST